MIKEEIIKYWNKNRNIINQKYEEFKEPATNERILNELIFCILTPMSKPENAMSFLLRYEIYDLDYISLNEIHRRLTACKIRFPLMKATYLENFYNKRTVSLNHIKDNINNPVIRDYIINIKGISYKEASHFLRNMGREDVAILDRHILRSLKELGLVEKDDYPKKREDYLEIERIYLDFAKSLNISGGKLDLVLFGLKTGKIIK